MAGGPDDVEHRDAARSPEAHRPWVVRGGSLGRKQNAMGRGEAPLGGPRDAHRQSPNPHCHSVSAATAAVSARRMRGPSETG